MPSLRNKLIHTIDAAYEDGRKVFSMDGLLREAYPGVPLDAFDEEFVSDKIISAMHAVEEHRSVHFIPLTAYYFKRHIKELPETEAEARRCIAGGGGRTPERPNSGPPRSSPAESHSASAVTTSPQRSVC